jgi:hypothetical protein
VRIEAVWPQCSGFSHLRPSCERSNSNEILSIGDLVSKSDALYPRWRMGLPGESIPIVVEPLELPEPARDPSREGLPGAPEFDPAEERPGEREPAPP